MKKVLIYFMVFILYFFIGIAFYFMTPLIGSKSAIYIVMISMFLLWIATVWYMEIDNIIIKTTKKAKALFNYFDVDAVKELLNSKKVKGDRFQMFNSDDSNQRITVLTIKILNNDIILKLDEEKRLRAFGKLLEIIEKNIEKRLGIIYNIKDDLITCLFNTVYMIDDPEFEAIKAALNINIDLLQERKENLNLSKISLDMSIVNEDMDFFIRGKRVLVNGDFRLSEEIVNIGGEDNIYISEDIFKKYMKKLDTDYLGKFYFYKDVKIYRVIKIIECNEEIIANTYNTSKINMKKGAEKKLKKYINEKEKIKNNN